MLSMEREQIHGAASGKYDDQRLQPTPSMLKMRRITNPTSGRCAVKSRFTFGLLLSLIVFGFSSLSQAADWPRQIQDSRGTHTLEKPPQRIVSTSVTLTGSLLAIDAPVVASGATSPGNRVADSQGFLKQWGDVAKQRQVQRLYIGEANAEAVAAQMPDLILISATGGDSAITLYDQLSAIAPTLIINYDDKSWQQLLTQLGEITGHEKQAAERIAHFDNQLALAKAKIALPPQPVTALVYNPAAHGANIWTPASAQGKLLAELGFTQAALPANLQTSQTQGKRRDIIQVGGENLAAGLNGETLFLFAGDEQDAAMLANNPLLKHLPAVQQQRVYPLGTETFRLDYYSASQLLTRLTQLFTPSS